jgi:hypothetical protein
MPKVLTKKELKNLIGQNVHVTYKAPHNDNIELVAPIIEADEGGIAIQLDAGPQVITMPKIKNIAWKNITFTSPKKHFNKEDNNALNMQMDKINTQIIEKMKGLPTYYHQERILQEEKNLPGSIRIRGIQVDQET